MEVKVEELHPIEHPVQFENIILPDESFYVEDGERKFTNEYCEAIERVKNFALRNRTATSSKKIYFFYGNVQVGEERLAEYFKSKGYEIISPERLALDEQLNVLINAESFASTIGSCSHNSLFLRDGTEAIFIPRAAKRFTGYQSAINQISNLNAIYVDSSLSFFASGNGVYCFIISRQLKEFFGEDFDSYSEDDLRIFLEYVRYSMSHGFKLNEGALQYYEPVYSELLTQLKQRKDLMEAYGVQLG